MVDVAVDSAIGAESDQVEGFAAALQLLGKGVEFRIVRDAAVPYGLADANELLADDPSGTNGEVTDFGVTHLIVGQADIGTARFD